MVATGNDFTGDVLLLESEKAGAKDFNMIKALADGVTVFEIRGDGFLGLDMIEIQTSGATINAGGLNVEVRNERTSERTSRRDATRRDTPRFAPHSHGAQGFLLIRSKRAFGSLRRLKTKKATRRVGIRPRRSRRQLTARSGRIAHSRRAPHVVAAPAVADPPQLGGITVVEDGVSFTNSDATSPAATITATSNAYTDAVLAVYQSGRTTGTTAFNLIEAGVSSSDVKFAVRGDGRFDTSGGIYVTAGGATIVTDGLIVNEGGIKALKDGVRVDEGGLRVHDGGATITASMTNQSAVIITSDLASNDEAVLSVRATAAASDNYNLFETIYDSDGSAVTVFAVTAEPKTIVNVGGLEVQAGGVNVTGGGLEVASGGATIKGGGLTVEANDITLTGDGDVVVDQGDVTLAAGDITLTAGGLTLSAGSIAMDAGASRAASPRRRASGGRGGPCGSAGSIYMYPAIASHSASTSPEKTDRALSTNFLRRAPCLRRGRRYHGRRHHRERHHHGGHSVRHGYRDVRLVNNGEEGARVRAARAGGVRITYRVLTHRCRARHRCTDTPPPAYTRGKNTQRHNCIHL